MNTLSVLLAAKGAKAAEAGGSNILIPILIIAVILFSLLLSMDLSWSNIVTGVRNSLVFENRNHEYGAYEIRRNYSKKLLLAMGVALLFGGLAVGTPKIMG